MAFDTNLLRQVWTGYLIKNFEQRADWLARSVNMTRYVNNDTIHLVDVGVEPEVLINNTTYPIGISELDDADKSFSLELFDTVNTPVPDHILYALSYDKIRVVIDQHNSALQKMTARKAIHAFAPDTHSDATPIVQTSGPVVNGLKRLTVEDIINLKRYFDKLKVPVDGRILVLHPDHVNDLLLTDEAFKQQYKDIRTGQILRLFGFDIYEFADMPVYKIDATTSELVKVAINEDTSGITTYPASVAYYAPRTIYARGSVKMFMQRAQDDPEYRRNLVGFRMRFAALPMRKEAIGAIVSAA